MAKTMLSLFFPAVLVFSRLKTNFEEPLSDTGNDKRDGVCLFMSTEISTKNWTPMYANKFIDWMRNVFLVSVERQFKIPCPGVKAFKLLIRGNQTDPKLAKLREYGGKVGEIPLVWHFHWQYGDIVKDTVLKRNCKWISTVYLDADDALLDGYFKLITEEIPIILDKTTTSDGKTWLGAVFALRAPRQLVLGLNRCKEVFDGFHWFCGYSQGQGVILRRSVWDKLNQKMLYHPRHTIFVKKWREYVMHGLGYKDYLSVAGEGKFKSYNRYNPKHRTFDESDATASQIKMLDLSRNWTTSALFVQTPFSSHFPWQFADELPECSKEHIYEIQRKFPQYIGYIIDMWLGHKDIHMTILEACSHNKYFLRTLRIHRNISCEQLEADWLKHHKYP